MQHKGTTSYHLRIDNDRKEEAIKIIRGIGRADLANHLLEAPSLEWTFVCTFHIEVSSPVFANVGLRLIRSGIASEIAIVGDVLPEVEFFRAAAQMEAESIRRSFESPSPPSDPPTA